MNSRKSGNHLTLLKQKAVQCGNDVEAQCQLLNELVNSGQTRQAFEHVVEKFGLFNRSLQWQRICEVKYKFFADDGFVFGSTGVFSRTFACDFDSRMIFLKLNFKRDARQTHVSVDVVSI